MIIDNGSRRRLEIAGVFEGTCGISKGVLSFVPNRFGSKPQQAIVGVLDGSVPIWLSDIAPTADARAFTARFEVIER